MSTRTPSPAPAPPRSQQPGPRASRLTSLLSSAVSHTAGALTYRHFASCFPTPAEHSSSALEGFHRDVTSRLGEMCNYELEALFKDRDVVGSLNELDDALAKAKRIKEEGGDVPVAPHTLGAEAILAGHLGGFVGEESRGLEARLKEVQRGNLETAEDIRRQRREMDELAATLEGVVRDLEEAASGIPGEVGALVEDGVGS